MARFLIGTVPAVGHVTPVAPIARQLVERGHEVWWYTGQVFQSTVEKTGAQFIPMVNALDYSEPTNVPEAWVEKRKSLQGLAQLKFDLKHFFIDGALGQVQDFTNVLSEFPADVLLGDSFFLGAAWVSEQSGLPWAQLGISVLTAKSRDTAPFGLGILPNSSALGRLRNVSLNWLLDKILLRDVLTYINQARSSLGLPPTTQGFFDVMSPFLYLAGTVPSFEYPRSDLPPQVYFVGAFPTDPPSEFTPPAWWNELQNDRFVVHVTQGTVATELEQLLIPTLEALKDEDLLVVATTGGKPIETEKFNAIPENARIEPFIPYYYLLPHVDVMVTNGGFNGVQSALANGIPLVAAGKTEDKPEVCARIEWTGIGINLKTNTPTPSQIKAAVQKLRSEPQFKAKAQALQTEISRYHAPTRSVELLEQLALTQQPIVRSIQ